MDKWNKISLYKYQQVEKINARADIADLDKVLFTVCAVFGMTEHQLDNTGLKKATRLMNTVSAIFNSKMDTKPEKRIGKYFLNYNPDELTFGQYVELSFYLQNAPIENAHKVMASISNTWLRKNNANDHRKKAEYFLGQPVKRIIGGLKLIVEQVKKFNDRHKDLFGLDDEVNGEKAAVDPFNKRYGWIYSASSVAEYERIKLQDVYALSVLHVFNDLKYLKAKNRYEYQQSKKK